MNTWTPPEDQLRLAILGAMILPIMGSWLLGTLRPHRGERLIGGRELGGTIIGAGCWTLAIYTITLECKLPSNTPGLFIPPEIQLAWMIICGITALLYILGYTWRSIP